MTGRTRLHPLTVVVATAREVLGILIAGATGLAAAGPVTGAWFALAGWVLGSLHQLLKWVTFSYVVHADRLELRRAFIGRSVTSIPVERIRGVDITASPLHRLFGLAVVLVDAGGGGDEGRLDAVSRAEAERLRRLLVMSQAAEPAVEPSPTCSLDTADTADIAGVTIAVADPADLAEPGRVLARVRPSWYLYAPLSGAYLLTPFVLLGVVYNLIGDLGLIGDRWAERAAGDATDAGPILAAAVLLAVVLIMPLASVVVFAVFNWDFTLRTTTPAGTAPASGPHPEFAGELVAERGLGTRRSVSLERRRIRGVELRDNPLERLAGVARLGAVVTGLGDSEHRGRLLPTAPRKTALDLAAQVVGGVPAPLIAHPPAARGRRVIRAIMVPLLVGAIALAARQPWIAAGCVAAAVAAVPLGLDRYRQLGHASDGARLAVRSGSLRRRLAIIEHRAVVGWRVNQTFFQRRLGLATLVAAVGAGDGAYPIIDIAEHDVVGLAAETTPDWLRPFIEHPHPRPANAAPAAAVSRAGERRT